MAQLTDEEKLERMRAELGGFSSSDSDSEPVAQEFLEGVASGAIGIGEGLTELVALGVDAIRDTNYAADVRDTAQGIRDTLGIDPEGFVGKGTEALVQFGIPGLGAVSGVSKLSKLGKMQRAFEEGGEALTKGQKFALGAQQLAAAGVADAMVATNNLTTIGDFFEGSPTQRDMTFGLTGREEAARLAMNRLKFGLEGSTMFVAAPYVVRGVGAVAAPVLSPVARGVQKAAKPVSDAAARLERRYVDGDETLGAVGTAAANIMAGLRYRGFLPDLVGNLRSVVPGMAQAKIRKATNVARRLDKELKTTMTELAKAHGGNSKVLLKESLDTIENWLTAPKRPQENLLDPLRAVDDDIQKSFDALPDTVKPMVNEMRDQIDDLSREILDGDYLAKALESDDKAVRETAQGVASAIEQGVHSYMRRRYRMFEDPTYKPDAATLEAGKQGFKASRSATEKEIIEARNLALTKEREDIVADIDQRFLMRNEDGELALKSVEVTDEAAEYATQSFLSRYKPEITRGAATAPSRTAAERINPGIFKNRKELKKFQRQLLGEVTGSTENFIATIADLATFRSVDEYFGGIRAAAEADPNGAVAKMFRAPGSTNPNAIALKGDEWGSLQGYTVPEAVYNDITRKVAGDYGFLPNTIRSLYSSFLQAKGVTQYSKTVLSPLTQIRNVTTASMFALAQGNVGSGANLGHSVSYVLNNVRRLPDKEKAEFLQELQEFGLIGQQAELRELQELINKGLASNKLISNEAGSTLGEEFVRRSEQGRLGNFLSDVAEKGRGVTRTAEDLYQGGDDIWKIYNYQFELNKLQKALRTMTPEEQVAELARRSGRSVDEITADGAKAVRREAANIVRDTVPNYSLAPQFIKDLRRLPTGNFIAFPFEIYRTGFNTLAKAVDELASTNAEIQKIGLRRLTGAVGTFSVLPTALSTAAYALTGVSEEEMKAYQRQFGYPWQKNNLLIPTGRTDEGLPTHIDFSYSNPYDQLGRAGRAIMNSYEAGIQNGLTAAQIVGEAAWESTTETFAPFLGPSIISEKLQDVLPREYFGRGGRMTTGALVYDDDPAVPLGEKVGKSFLHVMEAIVPAGVPIDVKGGQIEPSRFVRGLASIDPDGEVFGVSNYDKLGREFKLTDELVRAFTGITEIEPQEGNNFEYKAADFNRRNRAASSTFNRVADDVNATPQSLLDAFIAADEFRYRVHSDMYQTVKDLRTMGYSDKDIRKKFGDFGFKIGNTRILQDKYTPLSVSDFTKREMKRKGTLSLLPRAEIRAYRKSRNNIPFASSELFTEPEEMSLTLPTPEINPAPQLPSAPAPATMTPTAQPQSSVSPSLLGDNPIEQARNLELANRLRGQ